MTTTSRSEPPCHSNKGIIYKTLPRARPRLNSAQEPEEPISSLGCWDHSCAEQPVGHRAEPTLAGLAPQQLERKVSGSAEAPQVPLASWCKAHPPIVLFLKRRYEHQVLLHITFLHTGVSSHLLL